MKNNLLGASGIEVSPVGFGVLPVGRAQLNYSVEKGAALIRYALEKGVDFLDTAQCYETYPYIKEALKNSPHSPVVASKCLRHSYDEMKSAVEEARTEMNLDVIDIFMLHEVRGEADWESRSGAWEYLLEAKSRGIVKAVGVSTHHVDTALLCAGIPEIDILFPLINYKSLGIRKGDGQGTCEEMAKAIEINADAGKGVFAMKVFGGGNLTGDYFAAMDYVYNLPGIASLMIGFSDYHEIDRAVEYAKGTIDRNYVPEISKKRIVIDQGDCEGCGTCAKRCPNMAIKGNSRGLYEIDYSLCLTCGYCSPVCPVCGIIMY